VDHAGVPEGYTQGEIHRQSHCCRFDESVKAEEARRKLLELKREGFVDLEDVVVLVKDQYGTVRYHGMHEQAVKEGLLGSITGFIVGSILINPLVGGALGIASGAVAASLAKGGIDDRFVEDCRKIQTRVLRLFALVRKADPDRVEKHLPALAARSW